MDRCLYSSDSTISRMACRSSCVSRVGTTRGHGGESSRSHSRSAIVHCRSRAGRRPRTRRAACRPIMGAARSSPRRIVDLSAAEGTRRLARLRPVVRTKIISSRTTAPRMATRRSSFATLMQSASISPPSSRVVTTARGPRGSQERSVESGMSKSANNVMSPASTTAFRIWWSYWRRLMDCTTPYHYGLSIGGGRTRPHSDDKPSESR